jgi:hemolysin activation/secretion protein
VLLCLGAACAPRLAAQTAADAPAAPSAEAAPSPHPLKQILLADSIESAQKLSLQPGGRFVVAAGTLQNLATDDLIQRLAGARDHNIDTTLINAIAQVLNAYVRERGYLIVAISVPDQSIADGALRFAIVPGKFRQVKFVGNRWFSESQLRGGLRVSGGEIIRVPDLDQALAWTNDSNPFRRVQAQVQQVPNSNEADLIIGVQERLPLRLVANFDDAGNAIIGEHHYSIATTYANLWNLDHQVTYQYITTATGENFVGHVLNYRAPLPWRHYITFNASYLRARPTGIAGGYFDQDAKNLSGDLRYTIPFKRGDNPGELFANLNFKDSNSDLVFLGFDHTSTRTDVFELTFGSTLVHRDKIGAWVFGASVTLSPGDVNVRNSDAAFFSARGGTKARYAYGSLSFQRGLALDRGWELSSRGNAQISSESLLPSEQLSVGGSATVRGFNENVFVGDEGFVFNNDLLTPVWRRKVSLHGREYAPLETRFALFYDAAQVLNKHVAAFDPSFKPLASTGVGVRLNWASSFSASFDYGWQITHLPVAQTEQIHGRGHLKVMLAY